MNVSHLDYMRMAWLGTQVEVKASLRERLSDEDLSDLPLTLKVNLVEILSCNGGDMTVLSCEKLRCS